MYTRLIVHAIWPLEHSFPESRGSGVSQAEKFCLYSGVYVENFFFIGLIKTCLTGSALSFSRTPNLLKIVFVVTHYLCVIIYKKYPSALLVQMCSIDFLL